MGFNIHVVFVLLFFFQLVCYPLLFPALCLISISPVCVDSCWYFQVNEAFAWQVFCAYPCICFLSIKQKKKTFKSTFVLFEGNVFLPLSPFPFIFSNMLYFVSVFSPQLLFCSHVSALNIPLFFLFLKFLYSTFLALVWQFHLPPLYVWKIAQEVKRILTFFITHIATLLGNLVLTS